MLTVGQRDDGVAREVERAPHAEGAGVEDVGVDHGRRHVPVSEKLLDGADVVAALQKMGGEGMAQGVAADGLGDAGGARGVAYVALDGGFVAVVTAALSGGGVGVDAAGGKDPLPGPFARGAGVFGSQGVRQGNEASARGEVGAVLGLDALPGAPSKQADMVAGRVVTRSLRPLPSRTRISWRDDRCPSREAVGTRAAGDRRRRGGMRSVA